jgi:hypothetical protein
MTASSGQLWKVWWSAGAGSGAGLGATLGESSYKKCLNH